MRCGPVTRSPRLVALTLDDGPSLGTFRTLLILRRTGARATFFAVGRKVANPFMRLLVGLVLREGHQVENHTYTHELGQRRGSVCFATAPPSHQRAEIQATDRALRRSTRFLRVPGGLFPGDCVSQTIEVARGQGKVVVNWDVAGDTPGPTRVRHGRIVGMTRADLVQHYLSRVQPGSIILMHPENGLDAPYTLDILEAVIRRLQARGYVLVTLDELLAARTAPPRRSQGGLSRPRPRNSNRH